MRKLLMFLVLWMATAISALADVTILPGTTVTFATADEGAALLMERDDYVQSLGAFDRSVRLQTDKEVTEKAFLEFAGKNAINWPADDRIKVQTALDTIAPKLSIMGLPLPKKILMVRTTGDEEANSAYTRGAAIFLPPAELSRSPGLLQGTIAHELFHVLTRANPELREKAYAAIGFVKCNEVELPPALIARKISNPDAPKNDHYIALKVNDNAVLAMPMLISSSEKYDTARGGTFLQYLVFKWMVVERAADGNIRPQLKGTELQLLDMRQVTGFYEQVGRNTSYTIHPEEILADNFKLMIMGAQGLASPEITDKLRKVLLDTPAKKPATTSPH